MNNLSRRSLLKAGLFAVGSFYINSRGFSQDAAEDPSILGQNSYRYRPVPGWGVLDGNTPVNDCHGLVFDKKGRLLLLTNEIRNNVIVYDKSGKLLDSWGHDFPGAHGLTLVNENGEEFLFITDHDRHQVYKTTMSGEVLMTLEPPYDTDHYHVGNEYKPTHVVMRDDGDFYVLDGYGKCFIMHYDPKGNLKNIFGGRGNKPENVNEVHGGAIDHRGATPLLIVTSRADSSFRRFTLDGKLVDEILLTNGYPCFPIFHQDKIFVPQLWTADKKKTGFVTVLDQNNRILSNPGGAPADYGSDGILKPLQQTSPVFVHPHGLAVDEEENIYVAQWASGRTYPIKLQKI